MFLVLASTALAQWDTNVWPAWQHPRNGDAHAWQCYSGMVERLKVVDIFFTPVPKPAPSFWRFEKTNCERIKSNLVVMLTGVYQSTSNYVDRFVRQSETNYANTLNAHTNLLDVLNMNKRLPAQGLDNIFQDCRLPTNFFTYTPYRGINGLGPFTNDATVGHPHGWPVSTNDAGTNFPAGRTNWYTTDYGWDGITNVLGRLTKYERHPEWGVNDLHAYSNAYWTLFSEQPSWSDAQTALAASSPSASPNYYGHKTVGKYHIADSGYLADAYGNQVDMTLSTTYAQGGVTGQLISIVFLTSKPDFYYGDYDPMGTALSNQGAWTNADAYGWQQTVGAATTTLTSFSFPAPPWCSDPSSGYDRGDGYKISSKGWKVTEDVQGSGIGPELIYDFSLPGGFKFK